MTNKLLPLALLALCGCNLFALPTGERQDDDSKGKDAPPVSYKEQDYYDYIADCVQADVYSDSDAVVKAVEILAKTGQVKDTARIQPIRANLIEPIRDADKAAIISALKGK